MKLELPEIPPMSDQSQEANVKRLAAAESLLNGIEWALRVQISLGVTGTQRAADPLQTAHAQATEVYGWHARRILHPAQE